MTVDRTVERQDRAWPRRRSATHGASPQQDLQACAGLHGPHHSLTRVTVSQRHSVVRQRAHGIGFSVATSWRCARPAAAAHQPSRKHSGTNVRKPDRSMQEPGTWPQGALRHVPVQQVPHQFTQRNPVRIQSLARRLPTSRVRLSVPAGVSPHVPQPALFVVTHKSNSFSARRLPCLQAVKPRASRCLREHQQHEGLVLCLQSVGRNHQ